MRVRSDLEMFANQRRHALNRGIAFLFTLDEWVAWWEDHLGPQWRSLRGRRRGQFVMARNGDKGAYHPSNVRCIECTENQKEQQINGTAGSGWNKGVRGRPKKGNKLTPDQVLSIYAATGAQRKIAKSFGVDPSCVSLIKSGKIWGHLTEGGNKCAS